MPSKSFDNLLKLNAVSVTNNVNTFTTSISAPALSGTHFGDGSRLTGVVASGGTSTDSTKLPLAGGTLTGGLIGTTATFSTSISAPALSGVHFGDGSRLTGVSSSDKLPLSGGTLMGSLLGTTATFSTSVSAPALSGVHFGDGSRLTGVSSSDKLPLSGGTLMGSLLGTTATFSTSVSAPALSGVHFGDGSRLTGIASSSHTHAISAVTSLNAALDFRLSRLGGVVSGNLTLSNTTVQIGSDLDGEAAGDQSGYSVSMNSAGDRVAIGAIFNDGIGSNAGHVRIYSWNGSAWTQLGSDLDFGDAAGDNFGHSVSMNGAGDRVAIGAINNDGTGSNAGLVRIFSWNGSAWTQLGSDLDGITAGDLHGHSVSMNSAGNRVAIGAIGSTGFDPGRVRIYSWSGSAWTQLGSTLNGRFGTDYFGYSVCMNSAGDRVVIGAHRNDDGGSSAGAVYVYYWNGSDWAQLGSDLYGAAGDTFGHSVSMNSAGDRIAVGAITYGANADGQTKIYSWSGSAWTQLGLSIPAEAATDYSGQSVSLNSAGDRVAIGARYNDDNGYASGHTRIYSWNGSSWIKLGIDIDGEAENDWSGWSVSLNSAGDRVAIGAIYNDGNGSLSGHVRVYTIPHALLVGTAATFTTSVSAPAIYGKFYGDGSTLTGVGTDKLPLSGGTLTGSLSAPALSGTHFGDGSNLTGLGHLTKSYQLVVPGQTLNHTYYGDPAILDTLSPTQPFNQNSWSKGHGDTLSIRTIETGLGGEVFITSSNLDTNPRRWSDLNNYFDAVSVYAGIDEAAAQIQLDSIPLGNSGGPSSPTTGVAYLKSQDEFYFVRSGQLRKEPSKYSARRSTETSIDTRVEYFTLANNLEIYGGPVRVSAPIRSYGAQRVFVTTQNTTSKDWFIHSSVDGNSWETCSVTFQDMLSGGEMPPNWIYDIVVLDVINQNNTFSIQGKLIGSPVTEDYSGVQGPSRTAYSFFRADGLVSTVNCDYNSMFSLKAFEGGNMIVKVLSQRGASPQNVLDVKCIDVSRTIITGTIDNDPASDSFSTINYFGPRGFTPPEGSNSDHSLTIVSGFNGQTLITPSVHQYGRTQGILFDESRNTYVVSGEHGLLHTSTDGGNTWFNAGVPFGGQCIKDIVVNNNSYLAITDFTPAQVGFSFDKTNWTTIGGAIASMSATNICYSSVASRFFVYSTSSNVFYQASAVDAVWSQGVSFASNIEKIKQIGDALVVIGSSGTELSYTKNGVNYFTINTPISAVLDIEYDYTNQKFVICGNYKGTAGFAYADVLNGSGSTSFTLASAIVYDRATQIPTTLFYTGSAGPDRTSTLGAYCRGQSSVYYCTSGISWRARANVFNNSTSRVGVSIAFGNGVYLYAAGSDSLGRIYTSASTMYKSSDLITWDPTTTLPTYTGNGNLWGTVNLSFANGTFLAQNRFGSIATSTNGDSWTTVLSSQNSAASEIGIHGAALVPNTAGTFILAVAREKFSYSTNNTTWTTYNGPLSATGCTLDRATGKYVAWNRTQISTSSNGTTWSTPVNHGLTLLSNWDDGGAQNPRTVAAHNNIIVVGLNASSTGIRYSTDGGATFNDAVGQHLSSTIYISSIVYIDDRFVAATHSGVISYSFDGRIWFSQRLPSGAVTDVAYGNGAYVAFYSGSTTLYFYSLDGIGWARLSHGLSGTYNITFGNGVFMAISSTGRVITSTDGITWTTVNTLASTTYEIGYGGGVFVASSVNSLQYTANNGATWSVATISTNDWLRPAEITYFKGKFIAWPSSSTANRFFTSTGADGSVWSSVSAATFTYSFYSTKFASNASDTVLIKGETLGRIHRSTDGLTWTLIETGLTSSTITRVAYGSNKFVAIDTSGNVFYSIDDGLTWKFHPSGALVGSNSSYECLAFVNDKFVVVDGNSGNNFVGSTPYSLDGINWIYQTPRVDSLVNNQFGNYLFYVNSKLASTSSFGTLCLRQNSSNLGFHFVSVGKPYEGSYVSNIQGKGKFLALAGKTSQLDTAATGLAYSQDGGLTWDFSGLHSLAFTSNTYFDPNYFTYDVGYLNGAFIGNVYYYNRYLNDLTWYNFEPTSGYTTYRQSSLTTSIGATSRIAVLPRLKNVNNSLVGVGPAATVVTFNAPSVLKTKVPFSADFYDSTISTLNTWRPSFELGVVTMLETTKNAISYKDLTDVPSFPTTIAASPFTVVGSIDASVSISSPSFIGDGSNLYNINASTFNTVLSGVIPESYTTVPLTDAAYTGIAMSSNGTIQTAVAGVYFGDGNGQIRVSTDSGNTWVVKASASDWTSVAMSSGGNIQTAVVGGYYTTQNGYIYVSTDFGNTWVAKASALSWSGVAMSSNGTIQAATAEYGSIYISTDSGNTWTESLNVGAVVWRSIAMSSNGTIQTAVGAGSEIYVSTDSGSTWVAKASALDWVDVAMSSNGTIQTAVAAAQTGIISGFEYIYVSTDSGNTWTRKSSPVGWRSIAMSSNGTIQAAIGNYNGRLYISEDSGSTWIAKEGYNDNWTDIAMSSDGTKMTVVPSGNAFITRINYKDVLTTALDPINSTLTVNNGTFSKSVSAGALHLNTIFTQTLAQLSATSSTTFDLSSGMFFRTSLRASITTLNFINVPASPRVFSFKMQVVADGTARTIAWPVTVKWPGNIAPTITSTNGKIDTFSFLTYDAGATWYGRVITQNH